MWLRILFVVGCLVLPVLWGVLVNYAFDFWLTVRHPDNDDRIFPDYQI